MYRRTDRGALHAMNAKTVLLTIAGFVLLGIGAIGVVLPVLPTTPFVLLASGCFAGNPKMRSWLMRNAFFREHLTNYQQRVGLKKRTVAISLGFLWTTLILSTIALGTLWGGLLLASIGTAVSIHILCMSRPKRR